MKENNEFILLLEDDELSFMLAFLHTERYYGREELKEIRKKGRKRRTGNLINEKWYTFRSDI